MVSSLNLEKCPSLLRETLQIFIVTREMFIAIRNISIEILIDIGKASIKINDFFFHQN